MAGWGRGAVLVLMLLARAVATRQMLVDAGRACPAKTPSLAPLPVVISLLHYRDNYMVGQKESKQHTLATM
jgi:hypothetical protein